MDIATTLVGFLSTIINYLSPRIDNVLNLDQSVSSLEAALVELLEARDDLKKQVDRAELLGLTCTNQVKGWLERVENVETKVRSIAEGIENGSYSWRCCSPKNCCGKYKISQKVQQHLSLINELKGKAILDVKIADGLFLVPVVEIPSRPTIGLELILEEVQNLLEKENVGIIGIYGMGGIGKTTLLKSINNSFLTKEHGFHVVIWAVVSKEVTVEKIQQAIGVRLGLSWDESQFQELRASRIHSVMRKTKFLLLLDDVWKGLDFNLIGIPLPSKENGCKVIFTTRSLDVCSDMDADHKLKVELLNEKQSWQLFHEKVGSQILDTQTLIPSYAETIIRKCGGLPLALITIGRAMANKQTEEEWRYAIEVLNKSPSEFRGMEDVFTLLKFSYDSLGNDIVRICFLYCSLFPEDYGLEKEQLIGYWAGEGFLGSDDNFHIMGHSIIGSLKTACFLENGENETRVKMHDVVRSFALWVASDGGKEKAKFLMQASTGLTRAPESEHWGVAERISLLDNDITDLSGTPVCPHLTTLLLQLNSGLTKISQDFFRNMPNLKVLDLSFTSIREIPKSIGRLSDLRHLDLSGTKISALPKELGNLTRLEYLDLQRNRNLNSIPNAAISGLSQLRVLNFYYSFGDWELSHLVDEEEARLSDLENLPRLASLGITLANLSALESISGSRRLRRCVEYLYIRECEGLYNLQLSHSTGDGKRLRRLSINNCPDFKYLAIIDGAEDNWLPNLEILAMHGLPSLVSVWRNPMSKGCLRNLRCINIWYCDILKNVSWILQLPKLEMIYLFYCPEMEEVIRGDHAESEDYQNAFPQLRVMSIRKLPKLKSISKEKISFPSLKKIAVIDCPMLKRLPLKAQNVAELPTIYCYKEWWDSLEWDDAAIKTTVLPHFTAE
ncbi:OLC1v1037761C1 [Oldenlandia corymbosa var. corymbosa]|uniref:OLC1v1037761C1 n=1 Tax=Oldenlandia corymbosa var. corymbosa TaxID=529605 RepID=A0AAV1CZC9_OLDCO|nr:OLC1v1037761C1 [Oldenlandia corymbosa var. corymbosa]